MCNEREHIEDNDIDAVFREIDQALRNFSAEERAYKIVKSFFQIEDSSEKVHGMFLEWILSPVNVRAKQLAMERVFRECLDGKICLGGLEIEL